MSQKEYESMKQAVRADDRNVLWMKTLLCASAVAASCVMMLVCFHLRGF